MYEGTKERKQKKKIKEWLKNKRVRHTHQLGLYNLVARFGHFDYFDENCKALEKEGLKNLKT